MPDRSRKPKLPRDVNQRAKRIVDLLVGDVEDEETIKQAVEDGKNPAAVALGRRGGLKGGVARAQKLTAKRRTEIAKKAAKKRWAAKRALDKSE